LESRPIATVSRVAVAAAVVFALAHAAWSAWDQGFTADERVHLEWSRRLLDQREDERASVARFNTKTPVMLAHVLAEKAAGACGVASERGLRFAARLPSVAALAALLGAVFLLGRRWFGRTAALVATAACALDPNLVAHGSLATVDLPYALAVLLVLGAGLGFARRPSVRRGALVGACLGLAFAVKFSAVLLLPALALLPLAVGWPRADALRRALPGLATAAAVLPLTIAAAYLFTNMAPRLDALPATSAPMRAAAEGAPWLRLPLPAGFLTGLDRSLADERGRWNVYLFGRFHPTGVAYYFVASWALKTPVLIALGTLLGWVQALRSRVCRGDGTARFLAAALVLHLAYFSLLFRTQLGYRFVLMCVPLAYLLAAYGLAQSGALRPPAVAAVFAVATFEHAAYWGNPLAFTNAAVQPKRGVYRLMADSNLDWGQDRERIAGRVARAGAAHTELEPLHVLQGHLTVRVNDLVGVNGLERYRFLREHLAPGGHFGHTYLWYDVSAADFDRFLDAERRFEPAPDAGALCGGDLPLHPPGSRVPLVLEEPPGQVATWLVCAETRKQVDLVLKPSFGGIALGRWDAAAGCAGTEVAAPQELWSRLAPGTHALCLRELPNRRAWIPYRFEGTWIVRGHGVRLERRPLQGTQTSTSGMRQPSNDVPPSSTSSDSPDASRP
jgi:hypothetical protein